MGINNVKGKIVMKYKRLILILFLGLLLSGCSYSVLRYPVIPPIGNPINFTSAPIDITFKNTNMGSKVGYASTIQVWGFTWGDASIGGAAENGKIKIVKHVYYKFINVFAFFLKSTTIVYGD